MKNEDLKEEAITLIEKQIELYKVQDNNLSWNRRKCTTENRVKEKLKYKIKILEFILKILEEHKKEGIDE